MGKKSKRMAMVLAMAMVVQAVQPVPSVYAKEYIRTQGAKGNLSTHIQFDYPISYEKVKNQDMRVSLMQGKEVLLILDLGKADPVIVNKNNYRVEVKAHNAHGIELTTEEVIASYAISIQGLDQGTYTLKYEGEDYVTYQTEPIMIEDYSKHIMIHTGEETFSYGDLDGNDEVSDEDLKLLEEAIQQGNHSLDLNGDDKVDITELTYVKHQISSTGGEVQRDTSAIIPTVVVENVDKGIQEAGLTVTEGSISDLFTSDTKAPVTITKQADSEESTLTIPIDLGSESIETQVVEIVSPEGNGGLEAGFIEVAYLEDGEEKFESEPFGIVPSQYQGVHFIKRNEGKNTIVIDLGKKVPVKKVTIKVDKVVNTDGSPEYVVLEEVNFIKDIIPEGPQIDQSIVKDIKVIPGDGEVHLEWKPVANVQGYRVYYGEKPNQYTEELNVNVPYATVEGLENLTPYYFTVRAVSEDWLGGKSEEVVGTPQPSKPPKKPDFLSVEPMDQALKLSWGKTDDATYYKVFYKKLAEEQYQQFIPQGSSDGMIKGTSVAIGGLENGTAYGLYVVAGNNIGESRPSLEVEGTPEAIHLEGPDLPTKNRMDVANIQNIRMKDTKNIDKNEYPNGFNVQYDPGSNKDGIKNIVDHNYGTHWTAEARQYHKSEEMIFTFHEAMEMDYVIYVDRLDRIINEGTFRIQVWEEGDDLTQQGKSIVSGKEAKLFKDDKNREYYVLEFPKHKVKQIAVQMEQRSHSSISEVAFYEYDSLDGDIQALFANDAFTALAEGVTQEQIDTLRSRLNEEGTYYVSYNVFKDEIDLAESLLQGDTTSLGTIKDKFIAIHTTGDPKVVNTWSPLGIVAGPSTVFSIYADIPEGETLEIIPTQYYAEAGKFSGKPIVLTPGRNTIKLPHLHNLSGARGGSLYYRYSGTKADAIKLQIRDLTTSVSDSMKNIPILELYEWYELTEEVRREKIGVYIDELTQYLTPAMKDPQTNPFNATEISMRNMLLSVPADQILAGIQSNTASREEQIDKLYHNILAWEELMEIVHTTYGWDDPSHVISSRQNIRYMRMFGNAFMYAAGSHIGVGYGSVSALAQGKPTALTHSSGGDHGNSLFGWGIAHEIGHNMDRLGKLEITNNIYSLMAQTYDGENNTLPSRLELSDTYQDIYKKVAVGDKGLANDVFVQLGMYWQLHLAYDEDQANETHGPLSFYHNLFKVYDSGEVSGFSGDDKFAVAASQVAQRDLTEFFTKWGMSLSQEALAEMKQYPEEERKIQYITDETRRQRLAGNRGLSPLQLSATATLVENNQEVNNKTVEITIQEDGTFRKADLLGYEIFRDGKQIAFITGTTYEDYIGSANNMVFDYEVRAVDILGNVVSDKVDAGSIRIEHDNVIEPQYYNVRFETTTGAALTTTGPAIVIDFNKTMPVTGIKITSSPESVLSSDFKVEVGTKDNAGGYTYRVAKEGNFGSNEVEGTSKFINYFNKPGTQSTDTRIWTYDADVMRITGPGITESFFETYEVMPLSYPGDNVAFETYKMALMGHDYVDADGEVLLAKDTLVVVGSYRGDPLYNTIHIKGKFMESNGEQEVTYVERAMNGDLYMFAEVPEDGETSDISDGFFIFVPDIQKEAELQGHTDCSAVSVLPTQIMAEMYRYDTVTNEGSRRKTSETLWYTTPSYDSMPEVILQNTQAFRRQGGRDENN